MTQKYLRHGVAIKKIYCHTFLQKFRESMVDLTEDFFSESKFFFFAHCVRGPFAGKSTYNSYRYVEPNKEKWKTGSTLNK